MCNATTYTLVFILLSTLSSLACATIELPPLISDGAIFQRDEPIHVWGNASPKKWLEVEFASEKRRVQSDLDGRWHARFSPLPSGAGPYQLKVNAENESRIVSNILMGDIWVCSGQSNMEWVLRNTFDAQDEIKQAKNNRIRHFKIPRTWSSQKADTLAGGEWQTADKQTRGEFSAVAYYFAKEIQSATGIPIGLINSNWGGSNIESWMSPKALGVSEKSATKHIEQLLTDRAVIAEKVKVQLQSWPESVVSKIEQATADWSAAEVDTTAWRDIHAPSLWEKQGLAGVDGVVWYRKEFVLNAQQASTDIVLGLGRIDDNDITWVNGHQIGSTDAYDKPRRYLVAAKLLKTGKNTIAIRIEDTGGGGGIYSDRNLLYVQTASGEQLPLAGTWKMRPDKVTVILVEDMNHVPTALYNKMLHPLFDIPIKGVIWYQGESNAGTLEQAEHYVQQFPSLIADWRSSWKKPNLPFYWVQLANFNSNRDSESGSPWATLREAQTSALKLANTGQVITIDIGNPHDIHPRDKKTVGHRLAALALNKTYGRRDSHYRGPVINQLGWDKNQLTVKFDTTKGLKTRDNGEMVLGFEVATAKGEIFAVAGTIKGAVINLAVDRSIQPLEIRYAWSDNPENANLVDGFGFPAEPFRRKM